MADVITTHSLAREWLENPDGYITAKIHNGNGEEEYSIHSYQPVKTCANSDDTTMYWALNLGKRVCGNLGL